MPFEYVEIAQNFSVTGSPPRSAKTISPLYVIVYDIKVLHGCEDGRQAMVPLAVPLSFLNARAGHAELRPCPDSTEFVVTIIFCMTQNPAIIPTCEIRLPRLDNQNRVTTFH
ncbi:MAG TPA: hypothetical protein VMT62_16890 [Syntrophorhabdaceae bacterium]|nr:hypothetical protein [Syntrophorhabdaceae bacterium]